jgi:hypothetical protein
MNFQYMFTSSVGQAFEEFICRRNDAKISRRTFVMSEYHNGSTRNVSSSTSYKNSSKFMCSGKLIEIRDVWSENLEQELEKIRSLVERYKYIAMVC